MLLLMTLLFDQPSIQWVLYVIMIQYGSYLFFYLGWGLICFLVKNTNTISHIPDWRVEMVFNDLVLIEES